MSRWGIETQLIKDITPPQSASKILIFNHLESEIPMKKMSSYLKKIIELFIIINMSLIISACGGGGGGSNEDTVTISIDKQNLSFDLLQTESGALYIQGITATATGPISQNIYIGATVDGQGLNPPVLANIDTVNSTARMEFTPDTSTAAGTYSGNITMLACYDISCSKHYKGSPFVVPYTIRIRSLVKIAPSDVYLEVTSGMIGTPTTFSVEIPDGASPLETAYSSYENPYLDERSNLAWLKVTYDGNIVTATPDATNWITDNDQVVTGYVHAYAPNLNQSVASAKITLTIKGRLSQPTSTSPIPVINPYIITPPVQSNPRQIATTPTLKTTGMLLMQSPSNR